MGITVYTYRETLMSYKRPTIFVCVASDILEADKLFKGQFGKSPWKYVGCSFISRYEYL